MKIYKVPEVLRCDDPCPFGDVDCSGGPLKECYRNEF